MRWSCLIGAALVVFLNPARAATLNVTAYGAVANDAGDDRAAIQGAINAAAAGDTVLSPAGTYRSHPTEAGTTAEKLAVACGAAKNKDRRSAAHGSSRYRLRTPSTTSARAAFRPSPLSAGSPTGTHTRIAS